jgi:hypothetical protein
MQALVVEGVSDVMQTGARGEVDLVPVYHVILRGLRRSKQMLRNRC